jgi:hypothetical protein
MATTTIRFKTRSLIRRFGTDPVNVSEELAKQYTDRGQAIFVKMPVKKTEEEEVEKEEEEKIEVKILKKRKKDDEAVEQKTEEEKEKEEKA